VLERMMRELPELLQRNKDILDEVMLSASTCLLSELPLPMLPNSVTFCFQS
jgi:hypothetical protein